MKEFEIRCTPQQTQKALQLGASIEMDSHTHGIPYIQNGTNFYLCPTAEEMIGFLRSKGIKFHFDDETNYWNIGVDSGTLPLRWYGQSEDKELAAIDAALDYLSKKEEL